MLIRRNFRAAVLTAALLASGYALADTVVVDVTPGAMRYDGLPPYDVVTSPRYDVVAPRYYYYDTATTYYTAPTSSVWVPGYWSWNAVTHRNEWHPGRYVVVDRADYAYPPRWYGVPDYPYTYYSYEYPPRSLPQPRGHWEGGG